MTKTQAKANEPSNVSNVQDDEFSDWASVKRPFWRIDAGRVLVGEVLDIHRALAGKFGERDCLDVILLKPATVGAGKSKERLAPAGEIIRVEVRKAMNDLASMLAPGDKVRIEVLGKVPTDKGNDAWTFDVRYKKEPK